MPSGLSRRFGGLFKVPSTRGGKIRLLGLLSYSLATVLHPPLAVAVRTAVELIGQLVLR